MRGWLVGAAVMVAGCGGAAKLADLPAKVVLVSVTDAGSPVATVRLAYDDKKDTACRDLSSEVRVTLGAADLATVSSGGKTGGVAGSGYGAECIPGKWTLADRAQLPAASEALTALVITDPSQTVRCEAQHLMAPRRVSVVEPAGGSLRRGQRVVLKWSPATDDLRDVRVEWMVPACSQLNREILASAGPARPEGSGAAQVQGDTITFTVPADLPAACDGSATLDVSSSHAEGLRVGVARCEGATACEIRVGRYARSAGLTLAP